MGNYLLRAWPIRTCILASMAEFRTLRANPSLPRSKEAEGRTSLNKADAIRRYMTENPNASPSETAAALRKAGHNGVTPQYVSTIMCCDKRKSSNGANHDPIMAEDLLMAKELVRTTGGAKRATAVIRKLQELGS